MRARQRRRDIDEIHRDLVTHAVLELEDKYEKANYLIDNLGYLNVDAAFAIHVTPPCLSKRRNSYLKHCCLQPSTRPRYLQPNEVDDLVTWMNDQVNAHSSPTQTELLNHIREVVRHKRENYNVNKPRLPLGEPNSQWLYSFIKSNSDQFKVSSIAEYDDCRVNDVCLQEIDIFFEEFERLKNDYGVHTSMVFNIDEKILKAQSRRKNVKVVHHPDNHRPIRAFQPEQPATCGLFGIINAQGEKSRPALLCQHPYLDQLTDEQTHFFDTFAVTADNPPSVASSQESFYFLIDSWLIPNVEDMRRKHRLPPEEIAIVITDNHSSRFNEYSLSLLNENYIILLTLPPHTTHIFQPLDIGIFNPLQCAFNRARSNLIQDDTSPLVKKLIKGIIAYDISTTIENVRGAWRGAKLHPANKPNEVELHELFQHIVIPDENLHEVCNQHNRHSHFRILNGSEGITYYAELHNNVALLQSLLDNCNIHDLQ